MLLGRRQRPTLPYFPFSERRPGTRLLYSYYRYRRRGLALYPSRKGGGESTSPLLLSDRMKWYPSSPSLIRKEEVISFTIPSPKNEEGVLLSLTSPKRGRGQPSSPPVVKMEKGPCSSIPSRMWEKKAFPLYSYYRYRRRGLALYPYRKGGGELGYSRCDKAILFSSRHERGSAPLSLIFSNNKKGQSA